LFLRLKPAAEKNYPPSPAAIFSAACLPLRTA
jgi:hypothetical protein